MKLAMIMAAMPAAGARPDARQRARCGNAGGCGGGYTFGPRRWVARLAGAALAVALLPAVARAELKLCNTTEGRVGVVLGYQIGEEWTTEGWWTIPGQTCETLLKGRLPTRYFFIHAVDYDRGGEWGGETLLCLVDRPFTIRGAEDCEKRGYQEAGFLKVDTNDQREWTIRLTDPSDDREQK